MQLDLFEHAPRHYHESLRRLGRLDLEGCREELARHRRTARAGPDPEPVERAAGWLETRLPDPVSPVSAHGGAALRLCLLLRGGPESGDGTPDVPSLLGPSTELARKVVQHLARHALHRMAEHGIGPRTPLESHGLPWGALQVLAERAAAGRRALLEYLRDHKPRAAACLALGEACAAAGREDEAACAWREGFGLDPAGCGWAPVPERMAGLRAAYDGDPEFHGPWWVVGAYLDGRLPRYGDAPPGLVVRRWQRFVRDDGENFPQPAPARFFAGLFLSEQGAQLPAGDLARVRRTLAELHADAYQRHREQLEEAGPPRPAAGTEFFAW